MAEVAVAQTSWIAFLTRHYFGVMEQAKRVRRENFGALAMRTRLFRYVLRHTEECEMARTQIVCVASNNKSVMLLEIASQVWEVFIVQAEGYGPPIACSLDEDALLDGHNPASNEGHRSVRVTVSSTNRQNVTVGVHCGPEISLAPCFRLLWRSGWRGRLLPFTQIFRLVPKKVVTRDAVEKNPVRAMYQLKEESPSMSPSARRRR